MKEVILFLLMGTGLIASQREYNGYQLWRVTPKDASQVKLLMKIQDKFTADFWTEPSKGKPVEINVGPDDQKAFKSFLKKNGMQPKVVQSDVQGLIKATTSHNDLTIKALKILAKTQSLTLEQQQQFEANSRNNDPTLQKKFDEIMANLKKDPFFYIHLFVDDVLQSQPSSMTDRQRVMAEREQIERERQRIAEKRLNNADLQRVTKERQQIMEERQRIMEERQRIKEGREMKDSVVMKKINEKLQAVPFNVVNTFPRHTELNNWLTDMANGFHDLASAEDIGKTFEKRSMKIVKIGKPNHKPKPIIWIDSGIHGREWLTVGTTVWVINKMLTSYSNDPKMRELIDFFDWYFLPIANPDGYEYTHTTDRLWRKTRSAGVPGCAGTDPNRNWDFHWGASGTSDNPCSEIYKGPKPFSEKCTENMRDTILRHAKNIKLYISVHAYSQLLLVPWAWKENKPKDYDDMLEVAQRGASSLEKLDGTQFKVGTVPDIIFPASGGSFDWAKGVAGIKYSYTYELQPDIFSAEGFLVDETLIEPSGQEFWASLVSIADDIKSKIKTKSI